MDCGKCHGGPKKTNLEKADRTVADTLALVQAGKIDSSFATDAYHVSQVRSPSGHMKVGIIFTPDLTQNNAFRYGANGVSGAVENYKFETYNPMRPKPSAFAGLETFQRVSAYVKAHAEFNEIVNDFHNYDIVERNGKIYVYLGHSRCDAAFQLELDDSGEVITFKRFDGC